MSAVNTTIMGKTRESAEKDVEHIDYKMVTFSLGGKDFGIDIMKIAEIAKFGGFTYVPNVPSYVKGVYNLRGDIISIIDLRGMFHLPVPDTESEQTHNGLIVRVGESMIGVVVDSIDKVVGISSTDIQPPHPIFGDINIKYISGVVEHDSRLYIILDVDKVFSKETPPEPIATRERTETGAPPGDVPGPVRGPTDMRVSDTAAELGFVHETLATFLRFYVSEVNSAWVEERFRDWRTNRAGEASQLKNAAEAEKFIAPFFSPHTGEFWSESYASEFSSIIPETTGGTITVWNPGCGKGYETYSLVCLLREKLPNKQIKIWACDIDLLSISTAPNLVFASAAAPDYFDPYVHESNNGCSFDDTVRDAVLFEYHDIVNEQTLPPPDLIVARDVLSFLAPTDQKRVLADWFEKLKPGGVVIPGTHERLPFDEGWKRLDGEICAYTK